MTVIVADALLSEWSEPSFVPATVAVFESGPQLAIEVVALTVTVKVAPSAMSPKLQVRVPAVTSHKGELSVHVRPPGSGSLTVTPVAVPGPTFVILITKLATSPALMTADPATFSIFKFGGGGGAHSVPPQNVTCSKWPTTASPVFVSGVTTNFPCAPSQVRVEKPEATSAFGNSCVTRICPHLSAKFDA